MPSYDNLAGIYFDSQNQKLPFTGTTPATSSYHAHHYNQHRKAADHSYPLSRVGSSANIHDGLLLETFHSSSNLDITSIGEEQFTSNHSQFYSPPKKVALNTLPPEILTHILQQVLISSSGDDSANIQYHDLTRDFARLLTTCYAFYDVGIPILYRHVSFPHSRAFDKFRHSIEETGYGNLVKVLDFSAFTSVGLGRTAKMNVEIQMVTSSTILKALELCPGLKEFLVAESVDMDIDTRVLNQLVAMPYLDAVDFCGSTSTSQTGFTSSLVQSEFINDDNSMYNLTKVSFHGCTVIPSYAYDQLLPRLCNITRLDLTHTQVTPQALLSIPASAKITHLSLAKCVRLNSNGLMNFLALHPATRYLEWLNLMFESTKPVPLSTKDFETILEYLPPLSHINLHGLPVKKAHLKHLIAMDLESLSLGYADIKLEDLFEFLPQIPKLKYLDLTGNPYINMWSIQDSPRIFDANMNIDIYEFSADFINKLDGITINGFWKEKGRGRRGWMFRKRVDYGGVYDSSPTPMTPATQGFSFSALAQARLKGYNNVKKEFKNDNNPPPIGSEPSWRCVSRKINMCDIGIGGNMTYDACKERGIYLYYGFHV